MEKTEIIFVLTFFPCDQPWPIRLTHTEKTLSGVQCQSFAGFFSPLSRKWGGDHDPSVVRGGPTQTTNHISPHTSWRSTNNNAGQELISTVRENPRHKRSHQPTNQLIQDRQDRVLVPAFDLDSTAFIPYFRRLRHSSITHTCNYRYSCSSRCPSLVFFFFGGRTWCNIRAPAATRASSPPSISAKAKAETPAASQRFDAMATSVARSSFHLACSWRLNPSCREDPATSIHCAHNRYW